MRSWRRHFRFCSSPDGRNRLSPPARATVSAGARRHLHAARPKRGEHCFYRVWSIAVGVSASLDAQEAVHGYTRNFTVSSSRKDLRSCRSFGVRCRPAMSEHSEAQRSSSSLCRTWFRHAAGTAARQWQHDPGFRLQRLDRLGCQELPGHRPSIDPHHLMAMDQSPADRTTT